MDLDKLKKAARDKSAAALKRLTDLNEDDNTQDSDNESFDEFTEKADVRMDYSEPGSDDEIESTRRFNLRDMLSGLYKKGEELLRDDDGSDTIPENNTGIDDKPEADSGSPEADTDSSSEEKKESENVMSAPVSDEIRAYLEQISSGITALENSDTSKLYESKNSTREITERLDDISKRLSNIKVILDKQSDSNTKSVVNINAKLNAQDERLSDISASLGSVSKLNDSIFDLKNHQMNTRNSMDTLEKSFSVLRKKTIAGITVISILSAVLIVLEVLNLLS